VGRRAAVVAWLALALALACLPAAPARAQAPEAGCLAEVARLETAVAALERRLEEAEQHWTRGSGYRRFATARIRREARALARDIEVRRPALACTPAAGARLDALAAPLGRLSR
jgi:hypothetical protein